MPRSLSEAARLLVTRMLAWRSSSLRLVGHREASMENSHSSTPIAAVCYVRFRDLQTSPNCLHHMATKSWMFSLVTSQSSGPTSQPSDGEGLMLPVKDPKELGQAQSKHHFPVRLLQLHCEFCLIFSSTRHNRKMVQVQK